MDKAIISAQTIGQKSDAAKLIQELASRHINEIKPSLVTDREPGFSYPIAERLLGRTTRDICCLCDLLVDENVLERHFWQKISICPNCSSANLKAKFHCPKCSSVDIASGRLLEHLHCGHVAVEDEYKSAGDYICPKCKSKLKFLGTDYRSIGFNCICRTCGEIFNKKVTHLECQRCAHVFKQDKDNQREIYLYKLNPLNNQDDWLQFESVLKPRFVQALGNLGYSVAERIDTRARSTNSGVDQALSIIARKDNGFIIYTVGIGFIFDGESRRVVLEKLLRFDEKAFDLGIRDKVAIIIPGLSDNARLFAQQSRIKVFDYEEMESFLATTGSSPIRNVTVEPFNFQSRAQFLQYLESLGYRVEQGGFIEGRSGARYSFDLVTYYSDGIISHTMGIDIISAQSPVHLDMVSLFNAKAYDTAINDKILLVSPGLSKEAQVYVRKKNIKIIQVENPANLVA